MAEDLGLGFGETASVEMLPEDDSCRPKARTGLAARASSSRWALTCCLLSLPILAGLTTYLLVGQLRTQGEACMFQVSKTWSCPRDQQTPAGSLACPALISVDTSASWGSPGQGSLIHHPPSLPCLNMQRKCRMWGRAGGVFVFNISRELIVPFYVCVGTTSSHIFLDHYNCSALISRECSFSLKRIQHIL